MAPAEVASIVMDEDSHSMDLAVSEDQLSKAIGRGGQNVRLASELSGWTLNVMSEEDFEAKTEAETADLQRTFMQALDVDEDVALILVQEGFSSIEEVAYVPEEEMVQIEEFDADIVKELRDRARDVLLTQAIAQEEKLEGAQPDDDLLNMEGMDERTAFMLAANGIVTREDLAEQATDELMDIKDLAELGEERASALIMKAREIWFEESEEAGAN
jgi:N utilization substance protein A